MRGGGLRNQEGKRDLMGYSGVKHERIGNPPNQKSGRLRSKSCGVNIDGGSDKWGFGPETKKTGVKRKGAQKSH